VSRSIRRRGDHDRDGRSTARCLSGASRGSGRSAEADLVPVRVAVEDLADAIVVGLLLRRLDAALPYCRDAVVELSTKIVTTE
jgi:hypothetical protein